MDYSPWAQKPCIMFVDGNGDLRWWVKELLEREGFQVLLARNSVEAIVIAADYPFSIDVLITGAERTAHQNGLELAECFRVLRPETQVLLAADTAAGDALGWERMPKEFSRRQLVEAVERLVEPVCSNAA